MAKGKRRAPFRSLLIVAIPIAAILSATVVLALMHKRNMNVDIDLLIDQVSFSVDRSGGTGKLSTSVESIVVTNFQEISFSPRRLLHNGEPVPKNGSGYGVVFIRPQDDAISPRVRFRGEGLRFKELSIATGSTVTFRREEAGAVHIEMQHEAAETSQGEIGLGEEFELLVEGCDLVDEDGILLGDMDGDGYQRNYEVSPTEDRDSGFIGNDRVLKIVLEGLEEQVTLFSNTEVGQIEFKRLDDDTQRWTGTVKEGKVVITKIKKPIPIGDGDGRHFVSIDGDDLKVLSLQPRAKSSDMEIQLSGSVSSIGTGKSSKTIEDLPFPTMLEWLYSSRFMSTIIIIVGWAITQTLAIWKLILDTKAQGD